ncbi:AAA family ATPase [Acidianus ambivalens]|uniref:AAA family ATPase n=1 Tax=Acidianus ambivalens TaxID=2283 RepID=A0A650CU04_ACIAM|nr:AAA family ATPase [Acidianus ambivalens]MQL56188.1 AAA family ATPase [Acidianus ambivalens]QGR21273.1 AAA family ATPase [Acidianus ambivalens]
MFEIERRECKEIKNLKGWRLIYGRRKVGKTYLATRCLEYDDYYLISRTLNIIHENDEISLDEGINKIISLLKGGKKIILDEFQRLPEKYIDLLATAYPNGTLILLASSLGVLSKVVDRNSPLLGYVIPYKMGIIKFSDVLASVKDPYKALLFRDPWIIEHASDWSDVERNPQSFYYITKGLIGEIFQEEDRKLTQTYEAILLEVAGGMWNSSMISAKLQAGMDINPSKASSYLDTLFKMGLIKKIRVYKGGKGSEWYHDLDSPIMSVTFYAEAKYKVSEKGNKIVDLSYPISKELQFSIGEMLAEYYNAELAYVPQGDIDVVLLKKGKPFIAYEVKNKFTEKEARKAIERIKDFGISRAGLVGVLEDPPNSEDSIGPERLIEIAKEIKNRERNKNIREA